MIASFPHRYHVQLGEGMLRAPPRAPILLDAPPQFGGDDRAWSPEDLLIGAVVECLWTTFEAYARKEGIEVPGWTGDAVGVLDRGPGGPTFTSIAVTVELDVAADDEPRARQLLHTAADRCIVSRALRVPVTVEAQVRTV